jgi:hypothetical protein
MFIGHFGVGFAAKRVAPTLSLGTAFLAAQWLDLVWPTFLLLGWETVRIQPGATAVTPLVFEHYPLTHSLVGATAWGVLLGVVYALLRRDARTGIIVGLLVVSHWVLDTLVHVRTCPSPLTARLGSAWACGTPCRRRLPWKCPYSRPAFGSLPGPLGRGWTGWAAGHSVGWWASLRSSTRVTCSGRRRRTSRPLLGSAKRNGCSSRGATGCNRVWRGPTSAASRCQRKARNGHRQWLRLIGRHVGCTSATYSRQVRRGRPSKAATRSSGALHQPSRTSA